MPERGYGPPERPGDPGVHGSATPGARAIPTIEPTGSAAVSGFGFEALFEAAAWGLLLIRSDGQVLRVNSAAQRILGRAEDELRGSRFTALSAPDGARQWTEDTAEMLAGRLGRVTRPARLKGPDGRLVAVQMDAQIVGGGGGQPAAFLVQVRDVDTERAADRVRARREQLLRELLDGVPAAVTRHDRGGRCTFASGETEAVLGVPPSALLGSTLATCALEDDAAALAALFDAPGGAVRVSEPWATRQRPAGSDHGLPSRPRPVVWTVAKPTVDPRTGEVLEVMAVSVDIRTLVEHAPAPSEDHVLRACFHEAPIALAVAARDEQLLEANQLLSKLTGWSPDELRNMRLVDLVHPDHVAEVRRQHDLLAAGDESRAQGEVRLRRADGSTEWAQVTMVRVSVRPGEWADLLCIERVDDSQRIHLELIEAARQDLLTGLPNRRRAVESLGSALARSRRSGSRVGVLFCDLDGFKAINDSLGHGAGDHALVTVARRIEATIRAGDMPARIGGDEFLVVCENVADLPALQLLASRIRQRVAEPFDVAGEDVSVDMSIGAYLAAPGDTPDAVLANADQAMYSVKRATRS
ncbi:MAG: diguanylate cyclase domain-containing protein [Acidimicrobiales bacterium]